MLPVIHLDPDQTATLKTYLLHGMNGGFLATPAVFQRITAITAVECTSQIVWF